MKLVSVHFTEDSNGVRTLVNETEKPYSQGVNMDVEVELTHDSNGGPVMRPKTPPTH